jgi:hypothetical protein
VVAYGTIKSDGTVIYDGTENFTVISAGFESLVISIQDALDCSFLSMSQSSATIIPKAIVLTNVGSAEFGGQILENPPFECPSSGVSNNFRVSTAGAGWIHFQLIGEPLP